MQQAISGICPVCDALVGISTRGERQHPDRTSTWWLIDVHARDGKICDGSGRRI